MTLVVTLERDPQHARPTPEHSLLSHQRGARRTVVVVFVVFVVIVVVVIVVAVVVPGLSLESKRTRRHSRNLVCTFILPPSTSLPRSFPFLFFSSLSFALPLPRGCRLFDSLSQSEWHGAVGNKWPLMDFLDVRSRADADAMELRCSQECLGPSKVRRNSTLQESLVLISALPQPPSLPFFLSPLPRLLSTFGRSQLRDLIDADENFRATMVVCELFAFANNLDDIAVTSTAHAVSRVLPLFLSFLSWLTLSHSR